jgi:hypothetical protein
MYTTITIVLRADNEVDPVFIEKKFDNISPAPHLKEGSEIFITVNNKEEYLCRVSFMSWQLPANEINILVRPSFILRDLSDLKIKTLYFMSNGWKICTCNTSKKVIDYIEAKK